MAAAQPFEPFAAACMLGAAVTAVTGKRETGKTTKIAGLVRRLLHAYEESAEGGVLTIVSSG